MAIMIEIKAGHAASSAIYSRPGDRRNAVLTEQAPHSCEFLPICRLASSLLLSAKLAEVGVWRESAGLRKTARPDRIEVGVEGGG
jgi:hypothetical protein